MTEEQLRRLGGGRWQTKDERFTIEPQSGTWVVVDAQQHDDLGLPLVRGPFGSLADARVAIADAREEPEPASPLVGREPPRPREAAPSAGKAGPRLGTLPFAPSRPKGAEPTGSRPTLQVVPAPSLERGPEPETKTEAKGTPGPTARRGPAPKTQQGSTAGRGPAPKTEQGPAAKAAPEPTAKPGPKAKQERAKPSEPGPAPASGDPDWLVALPSGQRSGARALIERLESAGLEGASSIAQAELQRDEPAIARGILAQRLRALVDEERDADRLVPAILALVADGEDPDLEVRWRMVDGDDRPLGGAGEV